MVAGMGVGKISAPASRCSHGRCWPTGFSRNRFLQAGYFEQPRNAHPFRVDDDDVFRHHVPYEDHARTPESLRRTEAGDPQAASDGERGRRG